MVVVADRDASAVPDATGSASDTAALLELGERPPGTPDAQDARARLARRRHARAGSGSGACSTRFPTATGGGRARALRPGRTRSRIPPLVGWSNGSQRVGVGLQRTAADSISQEFDRAPGGTARPPQMIRLAFPLGIGARAELLDGGFDAMRFTGSGELPERSRTGVSDIDEDRLGSLGRAALRTLSAIDQSSRPLEHGPTAYVTVARQVVPGWALALLGFTLILPGPGGVDRRLRPREPQARNRSAAGCAGCWWRRCRCWPCWRSTRVLSGRASWPIRRRRRCRRTCGRCTPATRSRSACWPRWLRSSGRSRGAGRAVWAGGGACSTRRIRAPAPPWRSC